MWNSRRTHENFTRNREYAKTRHANNETRCVIGWIQSKNRPLLPINMVYTKTQLTSVEEEDVVSGEELGDYCDDCGIRFTDGCTCGEYEDEEGEKDVVSGEDKPRVECVEEVLGNEESRVSWAGTVASIESTWSEFSGYSTGYNSDDYWFSNKGCAGCSRRSFPDGMHPSQKYHMDGCLSNGFEKYRIKKGWDKEEERGDNKKQKT